MAKRSPVLTAVPAAVLVTLVSLLFPVAARAGGPGEHLRLAQPNASRFPEVTLYAYPTDPRGVFLRGLRAGAFRVTENGQPAEVTRVESDGGSVDVCLAVDRSLSMAVQGKFDHARTAAKEFVQHLGGEDRAAVISFGDGSRLDQGLTRDRGALLAALERSRPDGKTTTFLDALYWAINQVSLKPQGPGSVLGTAPARSDARRVVLALTDGNDLSSRTLPLEIVSYARANGVSLCLVALGDDANLGQLEDLARQTGGVYLRAPLPQDLARLYAELAQQLRSEYRITVRSPRPERDASRREIHLELAHHPLRAETWYQAPGQGSLLVTVPNADRVGQGVSAGAAGGGAAPGGNLIVGALLIVLGVGGTAAALLFWFGSRPQRLAIADSNPRLDLLPLWVRNGSTRLGRGAECDVVLDSREVSRVHARIEAQRGIYVLIDEGSINGTYVNGRRVRRQRQIRVGDVIRFGDREFRFSGELPA